MRPSPPPALAQRITCGKSAIHGWGAFAKLGHSRGDFVIEYIGQLARRRPARSQASAPPPPPYATTDPSPAPFPPPQVRPAVLEQRERTLYDRLIGAGTYTFRLDEGRFVDATQRGNMAHLINHSCDPNCYSRLVSADGDLHVVLFALKAPPSRRVSGFCCFYSHRPASFPPPRRTSRRERSCRTTTGSAASTRRCPATAARGAAAASSMCQATASTMTR